MLSTSSSTSCKHDSWTVPNYSNLKSIVLSQSNADYISFFNYVKSEGKKVSSYQRQLSWGPSQEQSRSKHKFSYNSGRLFYSDVKENWGQSDENLSEEFSGTESRIWAPHTDYLNFFWTHKPGALRTRSGDIPQFKQRKPEIDWGPLSVWSPFWSGSLLEPILTEIGARSEFSQLYQKLSFFNILFSTKSNMLVSNGLLIVDCS